MYGAELESFVQKFNDLWKAGKTAHLDIDTRDGYAWVTSKSWTPTNLSSEPT